MNRVYSDFDYEAEKKLTEFCQKHGSYMYSPGEYASMKCISCQNEHLAAQQTASIYEDCKDIESKFIKSGVESILHKIKVSNLNDHVPLKERQYEYLRNYVNTFKKNESKNLVITGHNFEKLNKVSAGITLSLIELGLNVAYAKNFDLFKNIREYFDYKKENRINFREIYSKADLLIVDNFSPKFLTDFQKYELESLVSCRHGDLLPTIFLTTFNVQQFFELIGEKAEWRIVSNYDFMNI